MPQLYTLSLKMSSHWKGDKYILILEYNDMLLTEFFTEDVAIANMITTMDGGNITNEMETSELSDILDARALVKGAIDDPINERHLYFEFLKYLRDNKGVEYSTRVHQKAAELLKAGNTIMKREEI